jgi:hypothetical protein
MKKVINVMLEMRHHKKITYYREGCIAILRPDKSGL